MRETELDIAFSVVGSLPRSDASSRLRRTPTSGNQDGQGKGMDPNPQGCIKTDPEQKK